MPGNTISSALANEFTEATGELYTSSLIALGLTLFIVTFVSSASPKPRSSAPSGGALMNDVWLYRRRNGPTPYS